MFQCFKWIRKKFSTTLHHGSTSCSMHCILCSTTLHSWSHLLNWIINSKSKCSKKNSVNLWSCNIPVKTIQLNIWLIIHILQCINFKLDCKYAKYDWCAAFSLFYRNYYKVVIQRAGDNDELIEDIAFTSLLHNHLFIAVATIESLHNWLFILVYRPVLP